MINTTNIKPIDALKFIVGNKFKYNLTRVIFLFLCVFQFGYSGNAQSKKEIKKSVEAFEVAMKSRDIEAMKALIAPDFMIGVYGGDTRDYLLESIVKVYPKINDIVFVKKESRKDITLAEVILKDSDGGEDRGNFAYEKNGLLIYTDFFDRLYKLDRYTDRGLVASIPFELAEGKIFIKLRLNDSPDLLTMIFDTGADGMALSPSASQRIGIKNTQERETAVVGGKTSVQFSKNNTVHINDSLDLDNQNLVIFPGLAGRADGLIGGGILRSFTTRIDFDKGVIELYDFNSYTPSKEVEVVPVDFNSGLPVIPVNYHLANKAEELTANMVFDTGAGYNMIFFGPYVGKENLEEGFKAEFYSTNYSMGMATPTKMGYMDYAKLGDFELQNILVSLQAHDPDKGEWNSDAGSFGLELIQKFNVTIDRLHHKLYLEANENYDRPTDFVLAGMILQFNDQNELEVKQVIGGTMASTEGIKPGYKIMMINDYTTDELMLVENINDLINEKDQDFLLRILTGDQMRQVTLSN
ncbi:aspartyl protease family protein [Echinicola sp. CAU 1574]|uniref:Aspartyl protease family protein n=2 Tax=Echinicola arenosa TaxID=2774144 RepID=A0ABR9AG79_9BACT|nr:aspartyl protease family protein [Echinicola arenosa]